MMLERANMVLDGAMARGPAGRYTLQASHPCITRTFLAAHGGLERLLRCKSGVDLDS